MIAPTGNWTGDVRAVYIPDGTLLASGSRDGSVRLWNVATGEPAGVLKGHEGPALDVAFSPDGRQIASVGFDGTVRLWDVSIRTAVKVLPGDAQGYRIAYGADGRLVAWDNTTGKPLEPELPVSIGLVEDQPEKCSGPIWLRGGIPVVSADGFAYEVRNRGTLCRCGWWVPSIGLRPEPVLPVMPVTNRRRSVSPSANSGTTASSVAVAKHPGCATCGVGDVGRCSGTAQVNSRIRPGAPCACLYTAW